MDILLFDINLIDENMMNQLAKKITSERKEKAMKYRFLNDRKRCICAERLIQYYLQSFAGIRGKIHYGYNEYGKPYLVQYPNIHFNISHSGDWVICGFSDHKIGVDIEKIQTCEDEIVEQFFTKTEKEYIYSEGEESDAIRFTKLWTLKESYIKYKGKGLTMDLASFSIDSKHNRVIVDNQIQKHVLLKQLQFKGYFIAATFEKDSNMNLKVLTASEMMGI